MAKDGAALSQIKQSASERRLVVVIGTGVSLALTNGKRPNLSWKGLIGNGFEFAETKGKIQSAQRKAWEGQLNSADVDDLLGAAEFMSRKLGSPNGELYARWLENEFKNVSPEHRGMINAIVALQATDIPICTLNYDRLLEDVTGLASISMSETNRVAAWMRREEKGVLHLHGVWDQPNSCVLGIRDYETTLSDDVRDLIQRALSSFGRLLFIGCGDTFSDPNFSALIDWLRKNLKAAAPQHYALVRSADVARRHADTSWQGFVDPIGYGENVGDLSGFLLNTFPKKAPAKTSRGTRALKTKDSAENKFLQEYRSFLIRDCGQMTIEGLGADMDTAQRKFDLEKLFVPLSLVPARPDISENDPDRELKLSQWLETNRGSVTFGKVFAKKKHLALLALPGGGKSLLLKRIAVAYADNDRRLSSNDELPDLKLTPILIRCREWKDYITRPIATILQSMDSITGQRSLAGFGDQIIPSLKKGNILLLVDGLDEIHSDADRTTFVENLEKFLGLYKRTRTVITSREAGFGLIAPSVARFCSRYQIAPLGDEAIRALCRHWFTLMSVDGGTPAQDAGDLSDRLLSTPSLRRLAENPLLLTMLLVVQKGAGKLPPDRVSLYNRAVEVLLDTWNIRGHAPLNSKEAVPQLACVAFELMRRGQQTATERDLLQLLELARESLPQIRRYASDAPDKFLKRVELRSSLLVEAGHQLEDGRTVPFYQFRHLTFQEHLAAVAAAEGDFIGYKKGDTVLTPLADVLAAEEWKEVVPIAAVLAKKQAEPLISALVTEGQKLRVLLEAGESFEGQKEWSRSLPAPIARLVECLVEEADAAPETISVALQLIALFAKSCSAPENWAKLVQGPYGRELLHQTDRIYRTMTWPRASWVRNTYGCLLALRHPMSHWHSEEGQNWLLESLRTSDRDTVTEALLIVGGYYWLEGSNS